MAINIPKKHHYIPEFLLAGFTDTGSKDGLLWVIDKNDGRQWQTKPSGIAFSKGFYDIETDDLPRDFIENAFAFFEEMAAPVIKKIIIKKSIPVGENFERLIMFLSIMAMRVPSVRRIFDGILKNIIEISTKDAFATEAHFNSIKERMKNDGIDVSNMKDYKELREFIFSDRYDIKIDQNWQIYTMWHGISIVYPWLIKRNWMLIAPKTGSTGFICSDRPLSLRWIKDEGPSFFGPGFGLEGTFVAMPLSKKLALFGTFERNIGGLQKDNSTVTLINTCTGMYSDRHIYFGEKDFSYFRKDMTVGSKDTLMEDIKKVKRRPDRSS